MNISFPMSLLIVLSALTLSCAIVASPTRADEPTRYVESAGGFSFVPPEGWVLREFRGAKYKVVIGPVTANFAANINVVGESFAGSLDAYVKTSITTLTQAIKGAGSSSKTISRRPTAWPRDGSSSRTNKTARSSDRSFTSSARARTSSSPPARRRAKPARLATLISRRR
jgi:hypothetical protein